MKCETVMILWHNKDPIYSADFDPTSNKFCTTGFDNEIKIWGYVKKADGHLSIEFLSSLIKHVKPVNIARFSPGGNLLASGSDDGSIVIWRLNTNATIPADSPMKEIWSVVTVLRVTTDCYDLSWSSDGQYLSTVSTDNSVSIWSPLSKTHHQLITEHSHYVQGVSWDPLNDYLITQSSDGTCRIYKNDKKKKEKKTTATESSILTVVNQDDSTTATATTTTTADDSTTNTTTTATADDLTTTSTPGRKNKLNLTISNVLSRRSYNNDSTPVADSNGKGGNEEMDIDTDAKNNQPDETSSTTTANKNKHEESLVHHRMFYDERASTFFRRPTWSPDGSIFITPTGKFKESPQSKYQSTSYIFSRHIRDRPLACLPSNNPTVVVKFSPIIYKLLDRDQTSGNDNNSNNNLFNLNYRMIFAISSQDTVAIYDTQKTDKPIALVSNLHYASITDVSWSSDGSLLLITSSDGFCSYISFQTNELGEPLPESEYSDSLKQCILYKKRAIINTTINDQTTTATETKSNKRKNDTVDNNNNTTSSSSATPNEESESENEQSKKQKLDDEIPSTLPTTIPSTLPQTVETTPSSSNTTTTTNNGEAKPKRRIQPNIISK